MKERIFSEIAL